MVRCVLLVDDHEVVRSALRRSFESAGFICCEAENGAKAVEQAEQLLPDLIVLDLAMPLMNGLQAAPLLRKKLPQTPIIMFTMYVTDALVQIAIAAGITVVVSKEEAVTHLLNKAHSLLTLAH
jgi:CheY-like chemotaxis protein